MSLRQARPLHRAQNGQGPVRRLTAGAGQASRARGRRRVGHETGQVAFGQQPRDGPLLLDALGAHVPHAHAVCGAAGREQQAARLVPLQQQPARQHVRGVRGPGRHQAGPGPRVPAAAQQVDLRRGGVCNYIGSGRAWGSGAGVGVGVGVGWVVS